MTPQTRFGRPGPNIVPRRPRRHIANYYDYRQVPAAGEAVWLAQGEMSQRQGEDRTDAGSVTTSPSSMPNSAQSPALISNAYRAGCLEEKL